MSQQNIKCPQCDNVHQVHIFRSGGQAKAIVSIGIPGCTFSTDSRRDISNLLGIEEKHRQRIRNGEMPVVEY